ncbi:MAPEG family protein [Aliiroseovarius sp. KMU-50]|uniref:MAPEG family protein n=1 Tax=Aliiroseovarius salicola TaxID=3009082 RepID=A0ABT4VWU3_9RHOB|nr:MAPEG family protein [Aliiroseovarius sp. KMU-50]MDA5092707.1 MAPEG family protein [Aliiroseovarius sp. KMU-50]
MSYLEFYTTLTALWVAVSWLPYILDRIATRGLMGALANYDPNAIPQSNWAQRAMRAHKVNVQAFVAFAPLAIIAMIRIPDDSYPGTLAMTFFFGIVAHYLIYCSGVIVLRTLAFAVASLSTVALALRLLDII